MSVIKIHLKSATRFVDGYCKTMKDMQAQRQWVSVLKELVVFVKRTSHGGPETDGYSP
jgi:hypothetical protein